MVFSVCQHKQAFFFRLFFRRWNSPFLERATKRGQCAFKRQNASALTASLIFCVGGLDVFARAANRQAAFPFLFARNFDTTGCQSFRAINQVFCHVRQPRHGVRFALFETYALASDFSALGRICHLLHSSFHASILRERQWWGLLSRCYRCWKRCLLTKVTLEHWRR